MGDWAGEGKKKNVRKSGMGWSCGCKCIMQDESCFGSGGNRRSVRAGDFKQSVSRAKDVERHASPGLQAWAVTAQYSLGSLYLLPLPVESLARQPFLTKAQSHPTNEVF